ncbi:MAG: DUF3991 domain-containing protein [Croceibacterium sp.]
MKRAGHAAALGLGTKEVRVMRSDREIEELRKAVDCRVLLERDGWALDRKESTRKAVKYRRGQGEIIIVIHEGRGWFDPLSDKKGDVFNLAQALWGSSFGAARVALRPFAGVAPAPQEWMREHHAFPALTPQGRWNRRGSPRRSSPTWRYLVEVRGIPPDIVAVVIANGLLREGPRGSMWAAHHDHGGVLTGWEERGPHWRGFSRDGTKVLFRLGASEPRRLCVTEAAIDAISLAAVEDLVPGTLYVSTGGGWGPASVAALAALAAKPGIALIAATDRNIQGERYAARLSELARDADRPFHRLAPALEDWNDQLRASRNTNRVNKKGILNTS